MLRRSPPLTASTSRSTNSPGRGGDHPILLVAHATGFHGRAYLPVAEHLAPPFHVFGLDFRGHGDTPSRARPRRRLGALRGRHHRRRRAPRRDARRAGRPRRVRSLEGRRRAARWPRPGARAVPPARRCSSRSPIPPRRLDAGRRAERTDRRAPAGAGRRFPRSRRPSPTSRRSRRSTPSTRPPSMPTSATASSPTRRACASSATPRSRPARSSSGRSSDTWGRWRGSRRPSSWSREGSAEWDPRCSPRRSPASCRTAGSSWTTTLDHFGPFTDPARSPP